MTRSYLTQSLVVFSVSFSSLLYAINLDIAINVPEPMMYQQQYDIEFIATNNTAQTIILDSFNVSVQVSDYSNNTDTFDDWSVIHNYADCRFRHPNFRSVLFSESGTRFSCNQLPQLAPGESTSFIVKVEMNQLAHYEIFGAVGSTPFYQVVAAQPSLIDTDGDGAIDVEEVLSGTDPLDNSSSPSSVEIDLLFFYTPDFDSVYDDVQTDDFFKGFIDYANEVFEQNNIRIQLSSVGSFPTGTLATGEGDHYSNLISGAANRRSGFESLALLERELSPDIVGVVDTFESFEAAGRGQAISSGSPMAFFSAIDSYQVMLHELGHDLGADHDYENRNGVAEGILDIEPTYNFSYGYLETDTGSIMSFAPNRLNFFSSPVQFNCGLVVCGIDGLVKGVAANNVLTLNLRRLFMATTSSPDQDYDGMPDWYEQDNNLIFDFDHCMDEDNDGVPNVAEYKAQTDLFDSASLPADYQLWQDCERPVDRVLQTVTAENTPVELDLRVLDSEGRLMSVKPETFLGNLSWDIYGLGLYTFNPGLGQIGTNEFRMVIANGIAGEAIYTVSVGVGNDGDGDGVIDMDDAFPFDTTETTDSDGDGLGDNIDTDDDNDGTVDAEDAFPFDALQQLDTDKDGIGDNLETPERLIPSKFLNLIVVGRELTAPDGTTLTIPEGAAAVVLNVTAVNPVSAGYITVWPCGVERPLASNLNFISSDIVPNGVIAPIDREGAICFYSSSDIDLVVDIAGWFEALSFKGTTPTRLVDTRNGTGAPRAVVSPGQPLRVKVSELSVISSYGYYASVPADVNTVSLNITVVSPERPGFVTVWPCDVERPLASNLNFKTGQVIANGVIAPVSANGEVCIYSSAPSNIVVDLAGWFAIDSFLGARPNRLIDTRNGTGGTTGKLDSSSRLTVPVHGITLSVNGVDQTVPSTAVAAALNVTAVQPERSGFITVWPCGIERPLASNLNFVSGDVVANNVIVPIGEDGDVCFYSSAPSNLVVDISGWFEGSSSSGFVGSNPKRFIDTRSALGPAPE